MNLLIGKQQYCGQRFVVTNTKGGFPLSRNFYVRTDVNFNWLYVRKQNRDDVWKVARKRKS